MTYIVLAFSVLAAFGAGWWLRGLRPARPKPDADGCEWQVLKIAYRDKDRTREWYRHLVLTRYSSFEEANREAKRREGEDTLENVFNHEYVAVKAP